MKAVLLIALGLVCFFAATMAAENEMNFIFSGMIPGSGRHSEKCEKCKNHWSFDGRTEEMKENAWAWVQALLGTIPDQKETFQRVSENQDYALVWGFGAKLPAGWILYNITYDDLVAGSQMLPNSNTEFIRFERINENEVLIIATMRQVAPETDLVMDPAPGMWLVRMNEDNKVLDVLNMWNILLQQELGAAVKVPPN